MTDNPKRTCYMYGSEEENKKSFINGGVKE